MTMWHENVTSKRLKSLYNCTWIYNCKIYCNNHDQGIDSKNNIIEVDEIDGFSMLINKSKFENEIYFDENFFYILKTMTYV